MGVLFFKRSLFWTMKQLFIKLLQEARTREIFSKHNTNTTLTKHKNKENTGELPNSSTLKD